jgi:hypothetical protein
VKERRIEASPASRERDLDRVGARPVTPRKLSDRHLAEVELLDEIPAPRIETADGAPERLPLFGLLDAFGGSELGVHHVRDDLAERLVLAVRQRDRRVEGLGPAPASPGLDARADHDLVEVRAELPGAPAEPTPAQLLEPHVRIPHDVLDVAVETPSPVHPVQHPPDAATEPVGEVGQVGRVLSGSERFEQLQF